MTSVLSRRNYPWKLDYLLLRVTSINDPWFIDPPAHRPTFIKALIHRRRSRYVVPIDQYKKNFLNNAYLPLIRPK